ncbi:MAG TPA: exodeoxyribonuclease VII small subunit [Chthoniobacteraceae bacterium]|jgi:exodeoxyribonuclease VII small subunit
MPAKSAAPKEPEQSFEIAIERLESIVGQMESDKMPLEELLVRYEEGIKLVKVCEEKLGAAEKRIELLTRDAAGKPVLSEFDPAISQATTAAVGTGTAPDDDVSLF